jgi:GNAT superfamily N-acetyltransferase
VLRGGARRGERCWVAAPAGGGAPVGVVTLGTTSRAIPSVAPGDVILRQLFVARSHWGSGVASALLEQALDAAREDGYATIWLATAAGAARARRFYARAGFTERGGHLDPALGLEVITAARPLDGVPPAGA